MTKHIERQIENLKERILRLGTLVEEAISKSITALINRDTSLAQRVIANDSEIDAMEVEVEEECLKMLALYQPVAADLRFVVAALKINNDLERMGDLARPASENLDAPKPDEGVRSTAASVPTGSPESAVPVRDQP
jgi:phosphate transport system protein